MLPWDGSTTSRTPLLPFPFPRRGPRGPHTPLGTCISLSHPRWMEQGLCLTKAVLLGAQARPRNHEVAMPPRPRATRGPRAAIGVTWITECQGLKEPRKLIVFPVWTGRAGLDADIPGGKSSSVRGSRPIPLLCNKTNATVPSESEPQPRQTKAQNSNGFGRGDGHSGPGEEPSGPLLQEEEEEEEGAFLPFSRLTTPRLSHQVIYS